MLNQKFYWSTIRKSIIAFGTMFNNITIDREDDDESVLQTIRVPLAYAPRQKFLARIQQLPDPATQARFQVVLPRMSFEMTSIEYDPSRKIAPTQQNRITNTTTETQTRQYAPAPYNINVSLYIYSRNQNDALQIVEQILPYFNPDFNLKFKAVPDLNISHDLPIILQNISYDDQYEGDLKDRRMIIWTLDFVMKLNFFGPAQKQSIIRSAIATTFSDVGLTDRQIRYNVSVDPTTAKPGDEIDFIETFDEDF